MSNPDTATTITINRGDRVLIAGPGGSLDGGELGFYVRDTRLLSRHRVTLDGEPLTVVEDATRRFYSARHVLAGAAPAQLSVERSVAGGIHEDLDLRNPGAAPVHAILGIELDADFADIFEVRGVAPAIERSPTATWSPERSELRFSYRSEEFARSLVVRIHADAAPDWRDGRLTFAVDLPARGSWHACLAWIPLLDAANLPDGAPVAQGDATGATAAEGADAAGHAATALPPEEDGRPLGSLTLHVDDVGVRGAWDQALWDMEALRLFLPEAGGLPVPAAGVPWYLTLFGRDAIITSLQALAGHPELARGTLAALAALQARDVDPVRDAEPGKILHEIRHGELAVRGLLPFQPYYGTHDATPLFVTLLARTFDWSGDRALLDRFLPAAEAAMRWIERDGDRDGDGFLEYATRSPHGFPNQGWKDDVAAIPHADGSPAPLPIALCEHQAYAYEARLALARLYVLAGRDADAARLRTDAATLRERFNERFWWEEEGSYYLGLDGNKAPIRSVASNAGLCLATGIVPADRAARVTQRLMADDMWSGWGIRTLAAGHPAYDPFSYHTGSVWPHDNAMIAAGFAAFGQRSGVATIARALFDAAATLPGHRLPELYAGLPRTSGAPPVGYPGSCVPQAWAASALFRMIELLCGLDARADPDGGVRLHMDPDLPAWLPSLRLEGLRIGNQVVAVAAEGRRATVAGLDAGIAVIQAPAPLPDGGAPPS